MPRPIFYVLLVAVALSLIPVALIFRASATRGRTAPRIQVVYDMDQQVYHKPQTENAFFADGMSMRKPVDGTVARGQLQDSDPLYRGTAPLDTTFVAEMPLPVTADLVTRGQARYEIYCAPCHGSGGRGDGMVQQRAATLTEGMNWTPPTDLTGETVVARPAGHLFNTITQGIRNMPAYGPQIPVDDRWAIVAYVRALQDAAGSQGQ